LTSKRRLARTGAGHQIQREDAALVKTATIGQREAVILAQDVLLNLHHARLAHPRRMRPGRAGTVIEIATNCRFMLMAVRAAVGVPMTVRMRARLVGKRVHRAVRMAMHRAIGMRMFVLVGLVCRLVCHTIDAALKPDFTLATTANGAHIPTPHLFPTYSISISRTRISSPLVGCIW
jgi:hypothetical protein